MKMKKWSEERQIVVALLLLLVSYIVLYWVGISSVVAGHPYHLLWLVIPYIAWVYAFARFLWDEVAMPPWAIAIAALWPFFPELAAVWWLWSEAIIPVARWRLSHKKRPKIRIGSLGVYLA